MNIYLNEYSRFFNRGGSETLWLNSYFTETTPIYMGQPQAVDVVRKTREVDPGCPSLV